MITITETTGSLFVEPFGDPQTKNFFLCECSCPCWEILQIFPKSKIPSLKWPTGIINLFYGIIILIPQPHFRFVDFFFFLIRLKTIQLKLIYSSRSPIPKCLLLVSQEKIQNFRMISLFPFKMSFCSVFSFLQKVSVTNFKQVKTNWEHKWRHSAKTGSFFPLKLSINNLFWPYQH